MVVETGHLVPTVGLSVYGMGNLASVVGPQGHANHEECSEDRQDVEVVNRRAVTRRPDEQPREHRVEDA